MDAIVFFFISNLFSGSVLSKYGTFTLGVFSVYFYRFNRFRFKVLILEFLVFGKQQK